MKHIKRIITYIIFTPLALIFWIFDSTGKYYFETIDIRYKYFSRGIGIFFSLFLAHIALSANWKHYPFYENKIASIDTVFVEKVIKVDEDECDNNIDIGCTIDFISNESDMVDEDGHIGSKFSLGVITGHLKYIYKVSNFGKKRKEFSFPSRGRIPFTKNGERIKEKEIYKIGTEGNKLTFSGDLFDFYDQKSRICKFDGIRFGTTNCNAKWNINDSLNIIEIVDSEERVHFRIEQINVNAIKYSGFFKDGDEYFIYADSLYVTKNEDNAMEKIKLIKPMLEHSLPNSYGKLKVN